MTWERDTAWVTLPFVYEPLTSVTYFGNPKDADLTIELSSGNRIEMPVNRLRVETECGIIVETTEHDDLSLIIRYTGDSLSLRSGRIGFSSSDVKWRTEFLNDARAWIQSDGQELGYVVDVELRLASTAPGSR